MTEPTAVPTLRTPPRLDKVPMDEALTRYFFCGHLPQAGGALGGGDHGVDAHVGVEQHVIEAAGAPFLLIEAPNYRRPALVVRRQLLFGAIGHIGVVLHEPVALGAHGGVYKDMEASRVAGKFARRAAAHDHAVALLRRVLDLFPDEPVHALAVEDLVIARGGRRVERFLPEGL